MARSLLRTEEDGVEMDVWSDTMAESIRVVSSHPAGSLLGVPVVWLLHGRGTGYDDLRRIVEGVGASLESAALPPHVVHAPWAHRLDGAAWWVDSLARDGRPLESALLHDVLPAVEQRMDIDPGRDLRIVAGYSMGGGAAVRWLLTRGDLFGAAALVSPAAYAERPPEKSSARWSGAFGIGSQRFDHETWERQMSYRRLLRDRPAEPEQATSVSIVVGDRQPIQNYGGQHSSLTLEAARLHTAFRDSETVRSALRVVDGGHDDDFWVPALVAALRLLRDPDASVNPP